MGFLGGNIIGTGFRKLGGGDVKLGAFRKTEIADTSKAAVSAAEAIQPRVEGLTDVAQSGATRRLLSQFASVLGPEVMELVQNNLRSGLKGELSKDVINTIQRTTAERAISGGVSGSEFARNTTLRDLGLTSMEQSQKALDSAGRWLSVAASKLPQFDFSGAFFPNTGLATQVDIANKTGQFQRDFVAEQLRAAQSFGAAMESDILGTEKFIEGIASNAIGGAMGGMV